jgi:hypothetical protein
MIKPLRELRGRLESAAAETDCPLPNLRISVT